MLCVAWGFSQSIHNPWITIKTKGHIVWIKRDKIVYVSDNLDDDLREHHGRSIISLMNGKDLNFDDYTADELIELINR